MSLHDPYSGDILSGHARSRPREYPKVPAEPGLVVEVRGDDFVGAVVGWERTYDGEFVRLEDRRGRGGGVRRRAVGQRGCRRERAGGRWRAREADAVERPAPAAEDHELLERLLAPGSEHQVAEAAAAVRSAQAELDLLTAGARDETIASAAAEVAAAEAALPDQLFQADEVLASADAQRAQATAEADPFDRTVLDQLLDMAAGAIARLTAAQMDVITHSYLPQGGAE